MIDACNDSEKNISKDFYDWYVNEKGEFFVRTGMLIVDKVLKENKRCAISFDFTDPDNAVFTSYNYNDQSPVCSWVFKRMDNLTMKDISFEIKFLSLTNMKKSDLLCSDNIREKVSGIAQDITKGYQRKGYRTSSVTDLLAKTLSAGLKDINKIAVTSFTYWSYALMYYISKQEAEEITTLFHNELNAEGKKVKAIYKYSGYIDLRDNRTYRPLIKKDPDEPVREYQRHIQKWSVRGHYRKTKSGLIWIESHTKGEGELEKRIYGTEDEKDLNIIPRVFEVERIVKKEPVSNIPIPQQSAVKEKEDVANVPVKKVTFIKRILKFFGFKI